MAENGDQNSARFIVKEIRNLSLAPGSSRAAQEPDRVSSFPQGYTGIAGCSTNEQMVAASVMQELALASEPARNLPLWLQGRRLAYARLCKRWGLLIRWMDFVDG